MAGERGTETCFSWTLVSEINIQIIQRTTKVLTSFSWAGDMCFFESYDFASLTCFSAATTCVSALGSMRRNPKNEGGALFDWESRLGRRMHGLIPAWEAGPLQVAPIMRNKPPTGLCLVLDQFFSSYNSFIGIEFHKINTGHQCVDGNEVGGCIFK